MIEKTLVHFELEDDFNIELEAGNIKYSSIVFIQDTGRIYTHGRFYTDYEEIKRVLFENGPGSVADAIKNLRNSILGGASEDYNTLAKIEAFLKNPQEFSPGPGISINKEEGKIKISTNIDNLSLISTEDGVLKVNTVDGGTY